MAVVNVISGKKDLPQQISIQDKPIASGGEGSFYSSSDKKYAVKIYHQPASNKPELLKRIISLGSDLGEANQIFAWPLGIVSHVDGKPKIGVVTKLVPPNYTELIDLILNQKYAYEQLKEGISWVNFIKIARGTAAAIRALHGRGLAYGDVHFRNFLVNHKSGDVQAIDLDGLIVEGFLPPQVKGMPGFIAPEIMMNNSNPGKLSDRHSLAVLILWTLLFRNVMQPRVCYDENDEFTDDSLGYGEYACFSEHPEDKRNWFDGIGVPFFRGGFLSYKFLTPKLQELTVRTLINGLHKPESRPMANAWEKALAETYDTLALCPECRQSFIYPYWIQPTFRRKCPFCGASIHPPMPAVLELLEERKKGNYISVRYVVLSHGLPLFEDLIEPGQIPPFTRRGKKMIAQAAWDKKQDHYWLINQNDSTWRILSSGGGSVKTKEAVPLRKGLTISFEPGKRLARVIEER
jgi:DNA-binding helix-hairpin-helix protein with protein kinase domain